MPAAAVIPAPIAYIKVVAVKTLVVEYLLYVVGPLRCDPFHEIAFVCFDLSLQTVYFEEIRVFKAGKCLEYFSME